eukprot:CAMPEP_0170545094 /NCGR_PEP_ID=MMETSP0211-20121228/3612_1 /TAXON_ID=311385 /ORGANISM="Pseudokeronopsis sp., Strain OXSARD2" /LENGTH=43 /DNA_ID= /DNA_START= /DNA_END= /DNA_ORIENTATION=
MALNFDDFKASIGDKSSDEKDSNKGGDHGYEASSDEDKGEDDM